MIQDTSLWAIARATQYLGKKQLYRELRPHHFFPEPRVK
jgi:hypothetical protein